MPPAGGFGIAQQPNGKLRVPDFFFHHVPPLSHIHGWIRPLVERLHFFQNRFGDFLRAAIALAEEPFSNAKIELRSCPTKENPDIALQKKSPEPQPDKPKPSEAQLAAPVTTAPQMSRVEMAAVAAAPMHTLFNLNESTAIPTWKRLVASKLERNKKYPSSAQAREEKGVVQLEFSVDRQGRLKSSRIVKSSGSDALDRETLDLVKRAQPFASPPAAMTGEEVFLVVPIRFNIH